LITFVRLASRLCSRAGTSRLGSLQKRAQRIDSARESRVYFLALRATPRITPKTTRKHAFRGNTVFSSSNRNRKVSPTFRSHASAAFDPAYMREARSSPNPLARHHTPLPYQFFVLARNLVGVVPWQEAAAVEVSTVPEVAATGELSTVLEAAAMRALSTVSYQAAAEMLGSVKVCSRWHLLNRICSLTFAATARGCRRLRSTMGGSSNSPMADGRRCRSSSRRLSVPARCIQRWRRWRSTRDSLRRT
jgi:hypothetical protein